MENKIFFAMMCILFNGIGVPCFLQGQVKRGVWRAVLGGILVVPAVINTVKGIILAYQILQMSDEEYAEKKGTFDAGWPTID